MFLGIRFLARPRASCTYVILSHNNNHDQRCPTFFMAPIVAIVCEKKPHAIYPFPSQLPPLPKNYTALMLSTACYGSRRTGAGRPSNRARSPHCSCPPSRSRGSNGGDHARFYHGHRARLRLREHSAGRARSQGWGEARCSGLQRNEVRGDVRVSALRPRSYGSDPSRRNSCGAF